MKKLQMKLTGFIVRKINEMNGESHTFSIIGWSFVAISAVLAINNYLPNEVKDFVEGVFTKLGTGLGI